MILVSAARLSWQFIVMLLHALALQYGSDAYNDTSGSGFIQQILPQDLVGLCQNMTSSEQKRKGVPLISKPRRVLASESQFTSQYPDYKKRYSVGRGPWGCSDVYFHPTKGDVCVNFIPRGNRVTDRMQDSVLRHLGLAHPFITNLVEVILLPSYVAIVKEYINDCSLLQYVSHKVILPEREARRYFQQTVIGIDYLHRRDIAHKDLKLENCIMSRAEGRAPLLKITGFESAKHERRHTAFTSNYRAYEYRAPELWGKRLFDSYDGKAADMWSLGVILFRLVFGQYPFTRPQRSIDYDSEAGELLQLKFPEDGPLEVSAECRQLIQGLLRFEKAERMTIKDVLEHPWFLKDIPAKALTINDQMQITENLSQYYRQRQSSEEVQQFLREAAATAEPEDLWKEKEDPNTVDDHQLQELTPEETKDHFNIMRMCLQEKQEMEANAHVPVAA